MCSVNTGKGSSIASLQPTSIGASFASAGGQPSASVGGDTLLTGATRPEGNAAGTSSTSAPPGTGGSRSAPRRATMLV